LRASALKEVEEVVVAVAEEDEVVVEAAEEAHVKNATSAIVSDTSLAIVVKSKTVVIGATALAISLKIALIPPTNVGFRADLRVTIVTRLVISLGIVPNLLRLATCAAKPVTFRANVNVEMIDVAAVVVEEEEVVVAVDPEEKAKTAMVVEKWVISLVIAPRERKKSVVVTSAAARATSLETATVVPVTVETRLPAIGKLFLSSQKNQAIQSDLDLS